MEISKRPFLAIALLAFLSGCESSKESITGIEDAARLPAKEFGVHGPPLLSRPLQQAWSDRPSAGFEPGWVDLYAGQDGFQIIAVLKDQSMGNSVDGFNRKTWLHGDVFEVFIQTDPEQYFEVQVTPENHRLFLRWSPQRFREFQEGQLSFDQATVPNEDFAHSQTIVDRHENRWTVLIQIPYSSLGLQPESIDPIPMRIAFARYDYDQENDSLVLSASPDFPQVAFHERDHWHRLPEIQITAD